MTIRIKLGNKIFNFWNTKLKYLLIIIFSLGSVFLAEDLKSQTYNLDVFNNKNYDDYRFSIRSSFCNASEVYSLNKADGVYSKFYEPFATVDTNNNIVWIDSAYSKSNYSQTEINFDFDYKIFENTRVFFSLPVTFTSLERSFKLDTLVPYPKGNGDTLFYQRTKDLYPDSNLNITLVNHISFGLRQYLQNSEEQYLYLFSEAKIALNKVRNISNNQNYTITEPLSNELSFGTAFGYKLDKMVIEGDFIYNHRDNAYLDRLIFNSQISYQNFEESAIYITYDIYSSLGLNNLRDISGASVETMETMKPKEIPLGYNLQQLGFGFWFDLSKKYLFDVSYKIAVDGENIWKTNVVKLHLVYKL